MTTIEINGKQYTIEQLERIVAQGKKEGKLRNEVCDLKHQVAFLEHQVEFLERNSIFPEPGTIEKYRLEFWS